MKFEHWIRTNKSALITTRRTSKKANEQDAAEKLSNQKPMHGMKTIAQREWWFELIIYTCRTRLTTPPKTYKIHRQARNKEINFYINTRQGHLQICTAKQRIRRHGEARIPSHNTLPRISSQRILVNATKLRINSCTWTMTSKGCGPQAQGTTCNIRWCRNRHMLYVFQIIRNSQARSTVIQVKASDNNFWKGKLFSHRQGTNHSDIDRQQKSWARITFARFSAQKNRTKYIVVRGFQTIRQMRRSV